VTKDETRLDRILAAHDVHVRATNRGRRDPDHGFAGARVWRRHLFNRKTMSDTACGGGV
jgi:hypothetical protein